MTDLRIYQTETAGRITLTRPQALNALSHGMIREIAAALARWRDDPSVALVLIDAEGERAFCAGGDLQQLHAAGRHGNHDVARAFWADEYRMNAMLARYPKPVVALLQGFTMGGGVGLGCHASHRVVCETSRIALPEVAIGLVPDVGSTHLLARAPGRIGEYLAATAARIGPGDAIHAGLADVFIPREYWIDLTTRLEDSGDLGILAAMSEAPPPGPIAAAQGWIDTAFAGSPTEIIATLEAEGGALAEGARAAIRASAPLAVACALANIRAHRPNGTIEDALTAEYRVAWRAVEQGDLLEGIRAAVIDKDRAPHWHPARIEDVTERQVAAMRAALDDNELRL